MRPSFTLIPFFLWFFFWCKEYLNIIFMYNYLYVMWIIHSINFRFLFCAGRFTSPDKCVVQFIETNQFASVGTAIAAFYLPLAIMIFLYSRVYYETKKRQKEVSRLQAGQVGVFRIFELCLYNAAFIHLIISSQRKFADLNFILDCIFLHWKWTCYYMPDYAAAY